MSIEAWIVAFLLAQPAVVNLVGTRVFEDIVPQGKAYPAITYTVVSGDRDAYSMDGPNPQVVNRVQLSIWATTGVQRRQLFDAVSLALDGYKGSDFGKTIQSVFIVNELNVHEAKAENEENDLFGKHVDLEITHEVIVPDRSSQIEKRCAFGYTADFGELCLRAGDDSTRVAFDVSAADMKTAAEAAYPQGGRCLVTLSVTGSSYSWYLIFENGFNGFAPAAVAMARGELLPLGVNAPCSPTLEYTDTGTDEPDFDPWIAELDTDGANVGWLGVGPLENQIENDDQSKGLEGAVADPADEIAWVGDSGGTELENALQVDLAVTKASGVYAIVNGTGGQVPVERREIPVVLGTLRKISATSDFAVINA